MVPGPTLTTKAGSTMAKTEVRTETQKRRWVSTALGFQMMEPHEDVRDRATGTLQGHKRLTGDRKVVESFLFLKQAKFHAGLVAMPVGRNDYEMQQLGVFVTDDPDLQVLLESEAAKNVKLGTADNLQEYPFEEEEGYKKTRKLKGKVLAALRED